METIQYQNHPRQQESFIENESELVFANPETFVI